MKKSTTASAPRNFLVTQMLDMKGKGAHRDKSKYSRKSKHRKAWD